MRTNKLRDIWANGGCATNGWLMIPDSFTTETLAHQGFDALTIDMQHGLIDYADTLAMLTAISTTDVVPVVRVPWLDPGVLMKVLDAGAYGVICPMINNAEEAAQMVSAVNYPPQGTRSFGPMRGMLYGGTDYVTAANDTIVAFAMIETKEGLDNLDDILRVDGLEAVYIGPSDLSLALGHPPGFDDTLKPITEALDHILAKCREHKVIAGIHCLTPEVAKKRMELGYQFVTVGADIGLITSAAQQALAVVGKGQLAKTGDY